MDETERLLREQLAKLHSDYERAYLAAAQPIIEALTYIESMKPPAPILLPAGRLGYFAGPLH